ncbi:MAG: nucleoside triphosphate pyrophosphohydrolase [Treponema sp.]|jgi:tetrapyrrole methylase family protein/MazG family protein|nr:nucleoside triphosphate pyrophosphohydrolase [Treponema sp.]
MNQIMDQAIHDEPLRKTACGPDSAFDRLRGIVARLRGPGGCPWDREQSPSTLRGDLIEETYECIEAIDEKEASHIKEELGDLFLLVTMISYMHEEAGAFTVADVLNGVSEKLLRRHPHVFGAAAEPLSFANERGSPAPLSSREVLKNWARIKVEQEGRRPKDSILDEVSRSLPPLDRAFRLQKKAAKKGFDWPDLAGVTGKLREELAETEEAAAAAADEVSDEVSDNAPALAGISSGREKLEEELGDLLFSAVNLCRYLKVEPSVALRRANEKFTRRFKHVERRMKENGKEMTAENLAVMDAYWEEAKSGPT